MISEIQIKNVASYDSEGIKIGTDRKINFFFGCNGTGKSTIAKYLRDLMLASPEQDPIFSDCSISGFDPSIQKILVYNEDFRNENFILKDEQKGIFSLNTTNADIDRQIQTITNYINNLKRLLENADRRKQNIESLRDKKTLDLINFVFSKRSVFRDCRNAVIPYGGNKKMFLGHIKNYLNNTSSKSLSELLLEYNRIYNNGIQEIPMTITLSAFQSLITLEGEISKILDEVIVGNKDVDIAALIDQLGMSSWVEEGLVYFEKTDAKCPFCQQEIIGRDILCKKFERFFDASYKLKMRNLQEKSSSYYKELSMQITILNEIVKIYNPENKVSLLIENLSKLKECFVQTIRKKKEKPNERQIIESLSNYVTQIEEVIYTVDKNNQDYRNISSLKEQWLADVQVFIALESKASIEYYDNWQNKIDKILKLNSEIQTYFNDRIMYQMQRIAILRQSTVNTTEAVANINKILENVGFDSFEIKEKASTNNPTVPLYYIKRKGLSGSNVYKSLSEGEKTFISFLYFYQLCLGTDDIVNSSSKKKIIVIDDPISSLDSQVMFVISTLIHQLARYKGNTNKSDRKEFLNPDIEQIFILTHNFYFYKEVSLNKRPINTFQYHHLLEKKKNISRLAKTDYNCIVKNDYTIMWDTLKRCKNNLSTDTCDNIMIANTMRRIIDSYVDFIGLSKSNSSTITWNALDSFEESSPEYIVASAFLSIINDGSHGVSVFDDVYYGDIVKQAPVVIFNTFKTLFKYIGRDHYEVMMAEEYDD